MNVREDRSCFYARNEFSIITDTLLDYLRSALCPRRHTSPVPSRAINPAHLHSLGIFYSLRLPANSPFCISSFLFHPPQDIKAMLSSGTRTKGAASAQRNPLKCKTTEGTADRRASQTERTEGPDVRRRYHQ